MTRWVLTGIVFGTMAAAWFIASVPADSLGLVFGVGILIAVGLSIRAPRFSLSVRGTVLAGGVAGLMGTSVGIGAPVLALLYQHFPARPCVQHSLIYISFLRLSRSSSCTWPDDSVRPS
jgi:uncharacterized membrane protein YfcA